MKRGRPVTTRRGRAAGGSEVRAWVNAEELAQIREAAGAAGLTVPEFLRRRALMEVGDDRP